MKNFAELDAKVCSCTAALNAKLEGTNGKRAILLCGGTGCLSSNSMDIKGKFDALRCIGACGIAPAVSINGKVYPKVSVTMVPKIIEEYRAMGGAEA